MDLLFQKVDLLLQNSGPFICEGGSSEPTEPPGYGPASVTVISINKIDFSSCADIVSIPSFIIMLIGYLLGYPTKFCNNKTNY